MQGVYAVLWLLCIHRRAHGNQYGGYPQGSCKDGRGLLWISGRGASDHRNYRDEGEDDDGLFDPGGPFGGWTPDRADRHGTDRYREAGLILR